MQQDKQRNESKFLKLYIAVWVLLSCYLLFHTWKWDPKDPFITADLFRVWFGLALFSGAWVGAAAWDTVDKIRSLRSWQGLGFALGFTFYMLSVLAFNAGVFVGLLFAFDAAIDRLNPKSGMEPVTIHPSVSSEVNRYLLFLFLIAVAIAEPLSVRKPLARWFSSNMESWLNLPNPPAWEAWYFRTTVRQGNRVEVTSPEMAAGQTVDVVVNLVK